jgi:predicted permease
MSQLLLLAISFVLGVVLRRSRRLPETAPEVLNGFIIYVSLPALTLLYLHDLRLDPALLAPASMPWLYFGFAYVLIVALARHFNWPRSIVGCLLLTAGMGNTSFVGLPMIEAYYGSDAIGIGLIADQAGSFMVLSTLGLMTATRFSSGDLSLMAMVRKIVSFPPFICAVVALSTQGVEIQGGLRSMLERLGQTLTPIALISVGMQLQLASFNESVRPLLVGLILKLLVLPGLILLIYALLFNVRDLMLQVTVFEAAMPPMITGGIIAMEYKLEPKLSALMVGIGIPLSFLTLAGWWWALGILS